MALVKFEATGEVGTRRLLQSGMLKHAVAATSCVLWSAGHATEVCAGEGGGISASLHPVKFSDCRDVLDKFGRAGHLGKLPWVEIRDRGSQHP